METGASTQKLRVLVVLTSNARRGAEIEGSELARQLQSVGIDAEAICLAPATASSVLDVPALGSRPLGLSTLWALRRRARRFDVVVAYGSSTLPACALALLGTRVPFVYRSIGDPSVWVRGRLHRWRTGLLMRRATHIVALWPGAAKSIRSLYSIDAGRVSVIPNARSADEYRPPTAEERTASRKRLALPADSAVVGCVGAISAEKRVGLAVDVVAGLDGVRLLVVGDGPDRADVQRHATRLLGDRAMFTGALDGVTDAYWAMDVLLLTSRTEGMPGVVIEAAMCGVPVVATDVGGLGRQVELGVHGTLVPVDAAPTSIARAVRDSLDDSASMRLTESGCTWAVVVRQWYSLFEWAQRSPESASASR